MERKEEENQSYHHFLRTPFIARHPYVFMFVSLHFQLHYPFFVFVWEGVCVSVSVSMCTYIHGRGESGRFSRANMRHSGSYPNVCDFVMIHEPKEN